MTGVADSASGSTNRHDPGGRDAIQSDTIIGDIFDGALNSARTTPVTVTLYGAANDGAPGEGDNIGAFEVVGGPAGDSLTNPTNLEGLRLSGGPGDDKLTGDLLNGEAGADTHLSNGKPGLMFGPVLYDLADTAEVMR